MKRYSKPTTDLSEFIKGKEIETPLVSDISVQRLIDDGLQAINREMRNLLLLSSKGKLEASDSRDLRDIIKLLFELKEREAASLRGISDEDLKLRAKAALNE